MSNYDKVDCQEKVESRLSELFDQLVPAVGHCKTVAGEIVRACNRVVYRWFNDGDMVGTGYGNITVNPACRFLADKCRPFSVNCYIFDMLPGSYPRIYAIEGEYHALLFQDMERIIKMLDEHPELFSKDNTEDMHDYLKSIDEEEERTDWAEDDDYDEEEY